MKILYIFYQSHHQANGGVNSLWEIVQSFEEFNPILLTNRETAITKLAISKGLKVYYFRENRRKGFFFKFISIFLFQFTLLKICLRHKIDILHFNDIMVLLNGIFLSKILRKKIVLNIRGVKEPSENYSIKWKIVILCDQIILLSHEMRNELVKRLPIKNKKLLSEKSKVIYSIVDLNKFSPVDLEVENELKSNLNFNNQQVNLVYPAAFNELKNQKQFILNSFKLVGKYNMHIHFVGDNTSYAKECKEIVEKKNLNNYYSFHGFSKTIYRFYQAADLVILVSKREGLARCMIESIACGKPVVSFDVVSANEILTANKCGIVVHQGNYEIFLDNVNHLCQNKSQMEEFSKNGRNLAMKLFSKEAIVASYQNIYLN